MKRLSIITALVGMLAGMPAFGGVDTGVDTTYELTDSTPGYSGWIELDAPPGSWNPTVNNSPIVAYDIITPEATFSSSDPDVSILNPPTPTMTWNADEITEISMTLTNSDPFSFTMTATMPGPITFSLSGTGFTTMVSTGELTVPDDNATWLLLAGISVALLGCSRGRGSVKGRPLRQGVNRLNAFVLKI